MRKPLAILLLALSFSAQAVDVTISMTASEINRLKVAIGEAKKLVDNQQPPQPRDATNAEAKQFVIERVKQFIHDHEGGKLVKQAVDAVVVPAFDPQ